MPEDFTSHPLTWPEKFLKSLDPSLAEQESIPRLNSSVFTKFDTQKMTDELIKDNNQVVWDIYSITNRVFMAVIPAVNYV